MTPRGFTLAELLIALAILGVIATFTIPKILQSQGDSQKKAVFKEAIASVNEILYSGLISGSLNKGLSGCTNTQYNYFSYFQTKMNAVKICTSDSTTEGCWPTPTGFANMDQPGFLLHNGAMVAGIDTCTSEGSNEWFAIDWNGTKGPNTEGDDQIQLYFCNGTGCSTSIKTGQVKSHPVSMPVSDALFNEIFE